MSDSMVRTRRWTRAEYDKLIDAGFFGPGDKIELLGGQLCVSEPQNSSHARGIWLGQEALQKALPPGWSVLAQLPIALDDESAPEPDLAVVSGGPRDYTDHPSRPALVVEVAAARDSGADWAEVGRALGMSRQGARQRFARK